MTDTWKKGKDIYKFYFEKSIKKSDIYKMGEDSPFLIEYDLIIATTHPDDQGDRITKEFIEKITSDLQDNKAHYYNHLTEQRKDLPIGKVKKSQTVSLPDGHFGTKLRIGISKTAPDIATLIEEGILSKGSIGGDVTDVDYSDEEQLFILKDGTCRESSTVGIPANNKTGIVNIFKTLRKTLDEPRKVNNKHIESEDSMANDIDAEELKKIFSTTAEEMISKIEKKFEKKQDETKLEMEKKFKEEKDAFELEKAELKKQFEISKTSAEEKAREAEELKKKLGGRQSGREDYDNKDNEIYTDEKYAMAKSLHDFGKFLRDATIGDKIILEGSLGTEGFDL